MVEVDKLDEIMKEFEEFKQHVEAITNVKGPLPIGQHVGKGYPRKVQSNIQHSAKNKQTTLPKKIVEIGQEVAIAEIAKRINKHTEKHISTTVHSLSQQTRKSSVKTRSGLTVTDKRTISLQRFPHKIEYRDWNLTGNDPIHFTGYWWGQQGSLAWFRRYAVTRIKIFGKNFSAGRKGSRFQGIGLEPMGKGNKAKRSTPLKAYKFFHRLAYPRRLPGEAKRRAPEGRGYDPTVTIYGRTRFPVFYEILADKKEQKVIISNIEKQLNRILTASFKKPKRG